MQCNVIQSHSSTFSQLPPSSPFPAANAFKTTISRFHIYKETSRESPGPGTYREANRWIKMSHRYTDPAALPPSSPAAGAAASAEEGAIKFRSTTAPSVPTREQRYGFIESETGELTMQVKGEGGDDNDNRMRAHDIRMCVLVSMCWHLGL